ncbi:hypothetical protein [Mycobacterium tilburgii]|uniref:hypothetical protein n=1 Tax=Mycobacterium tilburgii TaxID=44467 RepID=UPI0021B2A632|nr:hypothetical protein [Mycobacterium tilburgii]
MWWWPIRWDARVAARLAADGQIGAVVALAPYWPRDDADLIPPSTRLLVIHGTADTRTDPDSSRIQTLRAGDRGLDAQWMGIDGAHGVAGRPRRRDPAVLPSLAGRGGHRDPGLR